VEQAWAGMEDLMRVGEEMVAYAVDAVLRERLEELSLLKRDTEKLEPARRPGYPRITYDEAVEILRRKGVPIEWGDDLGADEERVLTEEFDRPFFITHFPKRIKSFYMKIDRSRPDVVLGFDLLAPEGYGEIIGGSEREDDYERLYARIVEEGLNPADYQWYLDLGIRPENLRKRPHGEDELAHYAKACIDIEYRFPWGWGELEGIANRGDYDLRRHQEVSGQDMTYFDEAAPEGEEKRYLPYVIEPSGGVDRSTLAFWLDAYDEEPDGDGVRVVSHIHRNLAPITVAALPLSRNEKLLPTARRVYDVLRKHFRTQYDDAQSIGRRYRRQDEIGTPYCVTIDFDTIDDDQVTIRDRDSMHQSRVPVSELVDILKDKLEHAW